VHRLAATLAALRLLLRFHCPPQRQDEAGPLGPTSSMVRA
jgi:hypothetical protein